MGDCRCDEGRDEVDAAEVHKVHQENVWIGQSHELSGWSMAAGYNIPVRAQDSARLVELMEVQRQMAMLQLTRQVGVSDDDVFIVEKFSLRALSSGPAPAYGTIRSSLVDPGSSANRTRSFIQHIELESSAGLIAIGWSHATFIPRRLYERIRSRAHSVVSGTSVGVTPGEAEALVVDDTDPVLSDHPSDHITAMQTIAAVERMVRQRAPRGRLVSLKLAFDKYIESIPQPQIQLRSKDTGRIQGRVIQHGVICSMFSGRVATTDEAKKEGYREPTHRRHGSVGRDRS